VAVAATDRNDAKASFSNFGNWITLSAPGVAIKSTLPNGEYGYKSGTSMASPMVAGVAALILAQGSGLSPSELENRLTGSSENIDGENLGYIGMLGSGRLNAAGSLLSINSISPSYAPTDTNLNVSVMGTALLEGMTIQFLKSGESTLTATNVVYQSASSMTGDFNLAGAAGGRWDVKLTSGSISVTLERGFAVTSPVYGVVPAGPTQGGAATLFPASGAQTVTIPAGAVGMTTLFDIDSRPVFPSITEGVDPYTPTNVGLEILATPAYSTLRNPLTITLTYRLGDLMDPLNEDALTIAVYNPATRRWEPLNSRVDKNLKTVTATVTHLSIFRILQHIPSSNLEKAIAFPNPFRTDRGHTRIVFDYLTAGSRIRLYDVTGALIHEMNDDNNDGQIIWSVTNESGQKVASGVYFYLITDSGGRKQRGRIGVAR